MDDRECMLKKVMEYGFSLDDLSLYLDTHPFDENALCMYNELMEDYQDACEEFEKKYGPLTMSDTAGECEWKWIENPWPWERGN